MAIYPLFQIDAFASEVFRGNPAAVVPLPAFLPNIVLQNIAEENNLSETAFVVSRPNGDYDLRWFTPKAEIEFCGHATIAAAHVLVAELGCKTPIVFHTQIGKLVVAHAKDGYTLRAPKYQCLPIPIDTGIKTLFGESVVGAYQAKNNIYIELPSAQAVKVYTPDIGGVTTYLENISTHTLMGISIMASGDGEFTDYDFVSRHFAPLHGVPEDPVTGSAHSAMAPFWAKRLGRKTRDKTKMRAYQCSQRGGALGLKVTKNAVYITGAAITYLRGEIIFAS